MRKTVFGFALILSVFTLTQCGDSKQNSEATAETQKALESFVEEQFDYPIPNSYQVTQMLQKANANYVFNITNSPDNAGNYESTWQQAMNLGIFGADLAYSSQYNRQEETVKFLQASKELIDNLNITTAFNQEMAARIEGNLENKDSLILIIGDSFQDTYNHLNVNGNEKTSLLVVAGSVIEGLHITSQLIISSDYDEMLLEVLANQKAQVQKLVEIMDAHAEDENVNRVLPTLRYIGLFFDQISPEAPITRGQFDDVYNSIRDMRSSIVG